MITDLPLLMRRALRIVGVDRQADVEELVRKHREYIAIENDSPMTSDLARQTKKTIGETIGRIAVIGRTPPRDIRDRFTATQGSPPELIEQLATDKSAFEQEWQMAHRHAVQALEAIPERGIIGANNITIATNQYGSPLQRTWDDCAALLRSIGQKPGARTGKAVRLARIVIEMATSKPAPHLTGLRFRQVARP